jgi:hypothetical protein
MFHGDTDRHRFPLAFVDLLIVYKSHGMIF